MKTLSFSFIGALLLGLSSLVHASCDPNTNYGTVSKVNPSSIDGSIHFSIEGGQTSALTSPTGYYTIPAGHPTYNQTYQLLLDAAKSQQTVYVRPIDSHCGPVTRANVAYIFVYF